MLKSISNFLFNRTTENTVIAPAHDREAHEFDIVELALDQISINPFQPRKTFTEEALAELAASIQEFGVIQPLVLRRTETGYELIAGERRLRASRQAGLEKVPCIIRLASDKEVAEMALIENLQREDLHFFEEAAGYEKLLTQFELTQEDLARRVGKNQSTIANKLRLLKLSPDIREHVFQACLTERHARALLKLEDTSIQKEILTMVVADKLTVRDTELLVEERLSPRSAKNPPKKRQTMLKVIKDVRIFINTVGELVRQMKKVGLDVKLSQTQDDDHVTITMIVPKRK